MNTGKNNYLKYIIIVAGAFLAYSIGAAFATGQEMVQYFGAFGKNGLIGILEGFLIFSIVLGGIVRDSAKNNLSTDQEIFTLYCGKYIAIFFTWFTRIFLALLCIVMISGAGATFEQTYGIPSLIGRILFGIICLVTALLGLRRIVDIIGRIGPLIILLVFVVNLYNAINGANTWAEGLEFLKSNDLGRASGSWAMAAFLYCNSCTLLQIPFLLSLVKNYADKNPGSTVLKGLILGLAAFMGTGAITVVAIIKNCTVLMGIQVPFLTMATQISPVFGIVYSFTVFLGIYTTTVPLLWTSCSVVAEEKTAKYNITAVALTVLSVVLGNVIPFSALLGYALNITGYISILLIVCMVIYWIRSAAKKKEA